MPPLALSCRQHPATEPATQRLQVTTAGDLIVTTPARAFTPATADGSGLSSDVTRISVDESQRGPSITHFGGAFNEQGWEALSVLSAADREAALRSLFDRETGLGLDYCRLPIGASDFAVDRYTLDESPGDYEMAAFSVARDRLRLIPYVKAALQVRPDLKFWASAWTPPTWMKSPATFDGGAFRDEPAIYEAYALYLARFVESYAAEGIAVDMVVPQNEPQELTRYPSCGWTPAQYITFLRDHAGPLFQKRGLTTRLFVGTINRDHWDLMSVLRDPGAARYVSGVAIQWHALAHASAVRELRPDLPIMQSETECGNNHWQPGFNPDRAGNDFDYAAHTWRRLHDFFRAGASSYMLWNLVLDEQGKNIDSEQPWPQNSPVVVERSTKRVVHTPMYWATKHFSHLVARGAQVVASTGYADQIAFLNPNGTLVVQVMNVTDQPLALSIERGDRARPLTLPARSFGSLLLPPS